MSATLVVAIPLALFGIISVLGFVGCVLHTHGYGNTYDNVIEGTAGLLAYWKLAEGSDATQAFDSKPNGTNFGTYTQGANVPYDSTDQSAPATGAVTPGANGLVPGDGSTCASFNGGFVKIPFSNSLLPSQGITIEAWVFPNWKMTDVQTAPAFRTVVSWFDTASTTGFDLFATPDNVWAAGVGDGSKFTEAKGTAQIALDPMTPSFVVMTWDSVSGMLNIFLNPTDPTAPPYAQKPAPAGFKAVQSPTAFFIGTGTSHTDPTQPLFPFNGLIQDVAYYGVALDPGTIVQHFQTGAPG